MDEAAKCRKERMGDEAFEKEEARIRRQERQFMRLAEARELDTASRIDEAMIIYEKLLQEGIEHAYVYLRLGILYRKARRYDDELRVMERALQVWRAFDYGDLVNKGGPMIAKYAARLEKARTLRDRVAKKSP